MCVGKCDDYSKIDQAEKALGRFQSESSAYCPPYVIKKDQLKLASQRLNQIYLPPHLDCNPRQLFSHPSQLKSHDWKQVATGLGDLLVPATESVKCGIWPNTLAHMVHSHYGNWLTVIMDCRIKEAFLLSVLQEVIKPLILIELLS